MLTIARVITERKKAAEEVRKPSEEWERTCDSISDLVFILDTDFRFVRVNKRALSKSDSASRHILIQKPTVI